MRFIGCMLLLFYGAVASGQEGEKAVPNPLHLEVWLLQPGEMKGEGTALPDCYVPLQQAFSLDNYGLRTRYEMLLQEREVAEVGLPASCRFVMQRLGQGKQGEWLVDARVKKDAADLIRSEVRLFPNTPMGYRGLPFSDTESGILLFCLLPDATKENGGDAPDESKPEAGEEENQEDRAEQEKKDSQNEEAQPTETQMDSEELQNVEALLESLEELDKREQEQLNRREHVDMVEQWW